MDDADHVIRVKGANLWQKERLLNIGIAHVPKTVSMVAWMDCDILMSSVSWPEDLSIALEESAVVQLFGSVSWLGPIDPDSGTEPEVASWPSITNEHISGTLAESTCTQWIRSDNPHVPIGDGYAWASRRELVARYGIYDCCIIGGGTRAFCLAALNRLDSLLRAPWLTVLQARHLEAWAKPFTNDVEGRVAYLPQEVRHMWHGPIARRRYGIRDWEFREFNFDPWNDIVLNSFDCWDWAPGRTEMARWVEDYFLGRLEDE